MSRSLPEYAEFDEWWKKATSAEKDEAMAVHVMQWERYSEGRFWMNRRDDGNQFGQPFVRQGTRVRAIEDSWSPTTKLGDAKDVLTKLRLTVTPKQDATETSSWLADVELKRQDQLWLGSGRTPQEAICKAALIVALFFPEKLVHSDLEAS